jgi:ketosteroid isomerase-like protein
MTWTGTETARAANDESTARVVRRNRDRRDTAQAMSQEIVEAVRESYAAWREGDLEALLRVSDPEIELLTSGSFPDLAPVYRGHRGLREFWEAMRAPWDWFHLDVKHIVEGEDCAAIVVAFRAQGKDSGVITDMEQGHAMRFRDGRAVMVSTHTSFEQALEAVGLRE